MNLQQIHPKVLVYLLEFSGNAGVMCQTPEMLECPHFNKAFSLFIGLSAEKNEAKDVHHKHYDNIGKEQLEDLQALCKKCHAEQSPSKSKRVG